MAPPYPERPIAEIASLRGWSVVMKPYWVIFYIFLTLKLCHVIDWSWLWIVSLALIGTALEVIIEFAKTEFPSACAAAYLPTYLGHTGGA